ncbi:AAA family ATPase [Nonomuraea ferruginea]|uniref:AAA family ATPase n=1 Tax=Nonomuraea ferruginea TaxID=46174 RepID=UPI00361ED74C
MKTTPHAGLRAPGSGPADPDAATAERRRLWDRSRFLAGLTAVYLVLALKVMADHPGIVPFADAVRVVARDHQWIFWLLGAEAARQLHLLAAERLPGYRRFWRRRVFGGWERWSHRRLDDWTRFRVARLAKIAVWVALLALVLAAVLGTSPAVALFEAPALLSRALPLVVQIAVPLVVIIVVFAGLLWFLSRSGVETYFPGDVTTRFADVWGQDHVVERIRQSLVLLERPGEIERRGGYVPGGLLLWGPPGTGKTLIAEAVAGETGKPYVVVDSGAFTGTFAGVGVLKVRTLFRKLRRLALRYGGVVILFDDADALGGRGRPGPPAEGGGLSGCHGPDYLSEESRSVLAFPGEPLGGGGGDARTQRALLTELSGLKEPRGLFNRTVRRLLGMRPKPPPPYRVLVILATERPDALDRALLGPGRVDRVHRVGHPSRAGRLRTYQGYFAEVAHELTAEQIGRLAAITPYATGATIKDLVNESLISAVRDGRETITWPDVLSARRQRLGPDEHVERERHAVAVHEACHAVVAYVTRSHQEIGLATIEKGAGDLGPSNGSTRWKSEYEADIMVSLASLAGERMFFGEDSSSGVRGDLHAATCLSALMESSWGMGSGVTSLPALRELGITGGRPGVLGAGRGQPGAAAGQDRGPARGAPPRRAVPRARPGDAPDAGRRRRGGDPPAASGAGRRRHDVRLRRVLPGPGGVPRGGRPRTPRTPPGGARPARRGGDHHPRPTRRRLHGAGPGNGDPPRLRGPRHGSRLDRRPRHGPGLAGSPWDGPRLAGSPWDGPRLARRLRRRHPRVGSRLARRLRRRHFRVGSGLARGARRGRCVASGCWLVRRVSCGEGSGAPPSGGG